MHYANRKQLNNHRCFTIKQNTLTPGHLLFWEPQNNFWNKKIYIIFQTNKTTHTNHTIRTFYGCKLLCNGCILLCNGCILQCNGCSMHSKHHTNLLHILVVLVFSCRYCRKIIGLCCSLNGLNEIFLDIVTNCQIWIILRIGLPPALI